MYDIEEAIKYYDPSSGIFKFPCIGLVHNIDLKSVLYISPIEHSGPYGYGEPTRNQYETEYRFSIALKDCGIIYIAVKKKGDWGEVPDYIYSVHRGMIEIWKELKTK